MNPGKMFGTSNRQGNETRALARGTAKVKKADDQVLARKGSDRLVKHPQQEQKMVQPPGKTVGRFLKKLNVY